MHQNDKKQPRTVSKNWKEQHEFCININKKWKKWVAMVDG